MKKLLALVLGVIMSLSLFTVTACGKSIFDGDYKKASAEEIAEITAGFAEAEVKAVDMASGVKMSLGMESIMGEDSMKIDANFKVTAVDNKIQASGEIKSTLTEGEETSKASIKYWNKDGVGYYNEKTTEDGETKEDKYKMPQSFDDMLGMMDVDSDMMDLSALIEEYGEMLNLETENENQYVRLYVDKSSSNIKLKVEIKFVEDGEGMTGNLYYVLDKDYNLVAVKVETEMTMTIMEVSSTSKITMTVEDWEGSIKYPSDLEDYKLFGIA